MIYGCSEFPATIALANLVTDQENFGFTINGDNEDDALGTELGPAGDINGDGIDDLILGAPSANVPDLPSSGYRAGKIFVVYGRAADVDGDGISDLLDNCTFVANPD